MKSEQFTLSNGLAVVYLHLPKSRQHRLLLDVPVGAAHDPKGMEGLSHVLEHTVFCGSESTNETDLLGSIRKANGSWNAFTGKDTTTYDLDASSQRPENLFVIADALRQFLTEPALDPERLGIEQNVIINEMRDGFDNLSMCPAVELDRIMHIGKHPHTNIIGTEESVSSISSEDLKRFIKKLRRGSYGSVRGRAVCKKRRSRDF